MVRGVICFRSDADCIVILWYVLELKLSNERNADLLSTYKKPISYHLRHIITLE